MSSILGFMGASLEEARKEWGWYFALGIALTLLGVAAIVYDVTATIASVYIFATLIFIAGIAQIAAAFQTRNSGAGHVILYLALGMLDLVVGFVLFKSPVAGALTLTLVLAVYFIFGGLSRIVFSLWMQLPHYGWAVFSGIVTVALGFLLWMQWPSSGLWFIGFAVGVNFMLFGIAWCASALKLKSVAITMPQIREGHYE